MDGNEVAGREMDKRLTHLEAEVQRLKQFEPKPRLFSFRMLLLAIAITFVATLIASSVSREGQDRRSYMRD